ncbi:hypothetical protein MJO28_007094 [Puccinia striiformis f. sp. tritici]|uniref:Uncharacterized protein n=1 Tax=Puccinia striiformis f. sp. tritici TaxID=168172 RepID=A0ACC0EE82_9BASI|nr:hypothetical protein Pst134EB_014200 [Puccinia striiformis f. sp. tritici]KAI7951410.1 hypothetical protein MJO28_007094 [Puccinia striiformis f. sp. tritici]
MSEARLGNESNSQGCKPPIPIDYDKFKNDRRISRPPGVPTLWSRPSNQPNSIPRLCGHSVHQPPGSKAPNVLPTTPRSPHDKQSEDPMKKPCSPRKTRVDQHAKLPEPVKKISSHLPREMEPRNSGQRESIGMEIPTSSKAKIESRNDRGKSNELSKKSPSHDTTIQQTGQKIKTMTIEELESRHKAALRKIQGRSGENESGGGIDKVQLRKKYEQEIDQIRAEIQLDKDSGRKRGQGHQRSTHSTDREGFQQAAQVPQNGPGKKIDSADHDKQPSSSSQSRRTAWLDY